MKNIVLAFVFLCFLNAPLNAQQNDAFQELIKNFTKEYPKLNIAPLNLSYVENLNTIQSMESILNQKDFFKFYLDQLIAFSPNELSAEEWRDCQHLRYEISINWERLNLEQVYIVANKDVELSQEGLIHAPLGEQWYLYFLKKWLSVDLSAEELMETGLIETENVQLEIQRIQKNLGFENDSIGFYNQLNEQQFLMKDKTQILNTFQQKKETVNKHFQQLFFDYKTSEIGIAQTPSDGMGDVPGYYSPNDQTFYFNLFNETFNTRKFDWLYLHEGIPGHHFQMNFEATQSNQSDFQSLFHYAAYAEGWAAYCEELGEAVGLYQNDFDYLGKLEWDLIRSVRVVLDIGLNYYGWTDEEALDFWKENIINQDDKAMREIVRMKRWPAQVLTYKIGAAKILELKEKMQQKLGDDFNIKEFHDKILKAGSVPLFLLENYVLN